MNFISGRKFNVRKINRGRCTASARSPLCRLDHLQCNVNNLTLLGARAIINAINKFNYSLGKINIDDLHMNEYGDDTEDRATAWQESWHVLSSTTHRIWLTEQT